MSAEHSLPDAFEDLEDLVEGWALAGAAALSQARLQSEMPEIDRFYQRMVGRMDAVMTYLQTLPKDADLADGERNLYHLASAFMEVAPAAELFRDPDVPDGYPAEKFLILE